MPPERFEVHCARTVRSLVAGRSLTGLTTMRVSTYYLLGALLLSGMAVELRTLVPMLPLAAYALVRALLFLAPEFAAFRVLFNAIWGLDGQDLLKGQVLGAVGAPVFSSIYTGSAIWRRINPLVHQGCPPLVLRQPVAELGELWLEVQGRRFCVQTTGLQLVGFGRFSLANYGTASDLRTPYLLADVLGGQSVYLIGRLHDTADCLSAHPGQPWCLLPASQVAAFSMQVVLDLALVAACAGLMLQALLG